jgi:hypothetical protein
MIVRAFRHIGDPQPLIANDIRVLLLEDDAGTPLCVACEYDRGAHVICTAQDDDFNKVLQNLGINKLTICDDLGDGTRDLSELKKMPLLLQGRQG